MELATDKVPWIETPLIKSQRLSEIAGCNVFLKLENLHPSGSFKSRGVGNYLLAALRRQQSQNHSEDGPVPPIHFYCSSGGNAGLACVHAAVTLGCPATIVVPLSTKLFMVEKLRTAGASNVIQEGETWVEADKYLREVLMAEATRSTESKETAVYVPPFDAQDIWDGNATMIGEILNQLEGAEKHYKIARDGSAPAGRVLPDVIICSVGGGGLLNGICQGIDRAGLSSKVKIIAMETLGADSLSQAIKKKELVTLPGITSVATHLGARTVSAKALENGLRDMVVSDVASDAAAVEACRRIADEQRLLVEPACGVCLVPIYDGSLSTLVPGLGPATNVVVVMCGGSAISTEILADYVKRYPYNFE